MNRAVGIGIVLLTMVSAWVQAPAQIRRDAFSREAELTDSGGSAFDDFGFSVSSIGNTVVTTTGGAIDIYVEPSGGWANMTVPTAQLTVSGDALIQVCISGTTIAAAGSSGVAYVYVMPASGWANTSQPNATLTASDGAIFTNVAINSNLVVAGAPTADGNQSQQGAAYAFAMPASGWSNMTETAKLTASDGTTNDHFGISVSASGDVVLVGAQDATVGTKCPKACHLFQGAGYVFVKPANGWVNMNQTAKLTTADGGPGDNFGSAVSINDNGATALIGASQTDTVTGPGAAYIFVKPSTGWQNTATYAARLTASDGVKFDTFGYCVALSGSSSNTAVVGAINATVDKNHWSQGKVYVFVEPSGGWKTSKETARLIASDGKAGDVFGYSVAINGTTIAIGTPYRAVGSHKAQGIVYIY
jgi:hypothetical protein